MGVTACEIKANFRFINHNAAAATGGKWKKRTEGTHFPHTLPRLTPHTHSHLVSISKVATDKSEQWLQHVQTLLQSLLQVIVSVLRQSAGHNGAYDWCCPMRDWQCHYRGVRVTLSLSVCVPHAHEEQQNQQPQQQQQPISACKWSQSKKNRMKATEATERSWENKNKNLLKGAADLGPAFTITLRFCVGRPCPIVRWGEVRLPGFDSDSVSVEWPQVRYTAEQCCQPGKSRGKM